MCHWQQTNKQVSGLSSCSDWWLLSCITGPYVLLCTSTYCTNTEPRVLRTTTLDWVVQDANGWRSIFRRRSKWTPRLTWNEDDKPGWTSEQTSILYQIPSTVYLAIVRMRRRRSGKRIDVVFLTKLAKRDLANFRYYLSKTWKEGILGIANKNAPYSTCSWLLLTERST